MGSSASVSVWLGLHWVPCLAKKDVVHGSFDPSRRVHGFVCALRRADKLASELIMTSREVRACARLALRGNPRVCVSCVLVLCVVFGWAQTGMAVFALRQQQVSAGAVGRIARDELRAVDGGEVHG